MMFFSRVAHRIANIAFIKKTLTENRFFVRLFFDLKYSREDPYKVKESPYEKEKYAKVREALGFADRFESVFEIGCGEGGMTKILAKKAGRVLGVGMSHLAIRRAKKRLEDFDNVRLRVMDVFREEPGETFDLVVCADVLYYFEPEQLPVMIERIVKWTRAGGHIFLVHARASADDDAGELLKKFGARTIHESFMARGGLETVRDDIYPEFRLTILRKAG